MKPKKDDIVKIVFANGIVEEGRVIEWDKGTEDPAVFSAVIKSIRSDNILIIPNINRHVVAVKICVEQPKPTLNIAQDIELEPDHYERDEGLRAKSLAELYQKKAEEERKLARALLTSKEPNGLTGRPYELGRTTIPRKLQPVPKYPKKKA